LNSSLPGGVQAILKEKKGDLESAAKILLQEFQKSGGVDEQLATLNDFLEFTNRQSQNLTQGILGGLNTHCAISGQELSNSSRVLFTDENSEYLIGSICADPDREPTSNILGQKHRRQFQNEGKHFLIDSDQLNSDQSKSPNIDLIHKFIKS